MISSQVIAIGFEEIVNDLHALTQKLNRPGDGFMVAGRAIQNHLKKHFRERNQEPNRQGFTKSGFWSQIRDSVQVVKLGEGAEVVINDPRFNQKYYGGTITPKDAGALSIPLENEFYGVRPSTFGRERFFFEPVHKGNVIGLLAEHLADGSIRAAYMLLSSVDQDADPKALPPLEDLEKTAVEALRGWIERQLSQS